LLASSFLRYYTDSAYSMKTNNTSRSKLSSYLTITWYARWAVLLITGFSVWLVQDVIWPAVITLLIVTALYNLFLKYSESKDYAWVTQRPIMLVTDSILGIFLVLATGGPESVYLALLPFMIISAAYWYGVNAALAVTLLQTALIYSYSLVVSVSSKSLEDLFIKMALALTIGVYVAWLSRSERIERNDLVVRDEEIDTERNRLLALIDHLEEAVFFIDQKQHLVDCNQVAIDFIGKKVLNKPIAETLLFTKDGSKKSSLDFSKLKGNLTINDLKLKLHDGSELAVSLRIVPYAVTGHQNGQVIIVRDISRDKSVDDERKEFIAVAAHELRTPLTIAQGNVSYALAAGVIQEGSEESKMLEIALRSLKQLSRIIKDMTHLTEFSSLDPNIDVEPVDPVVILSELKADFQDQAKVKGVKLEYSASDEPIPTVMTSSYIVQEILTTLINNAIKFTDSGKVELRVVKSKEMSGGVTFSVTDSGIGIGEGDKAKIFQKFFQAENYLTRKNGGTGLGLYIARHLAGRLSAKLWFESEKDKGSTFYLYVPAYSQYKKDFQKVVNAEAKDFIKNI